MPRNCFLVRNDLAESLTLNIEPEGALVPLLRGEEVSDIDTFATSPLTIRFAASADGELIVSLWPGDGELIVTKAGEDVLSGVVQESVHA